MTSVMQFFRTYVLSLTSPAFYEVVLRMPASRSFKYFALLQVLLALLYTLPLFVTMVAVDPRGVIDDVTAVYPDELAITVEDGRVSINQELPYAIPMPKAMADDVSMGDDDADQPASLVVFASEEQVGSVTSFFELDALVVVTENAVYARDGNPGGQMRAYMLPQDGFSGTVDRAKVDAFADAVSGHWFVRYRAYAVPAALIFFALLWVAFFVGYLVALVIYTAVVWLLAKLFLRSRMFTYGRLYQIGLHALTLIITVDVVLGMLGMTFFGGFIMLLAYLAWTVWILTELPVQMVPAVIENGRGKSQAKKTTTRKNPKR